MLPRLESVQCEELVSRFVEAWGGGPPATLLAFLPPDGSNRRAVLAELAAVDLELRWKHAAGTDTVARSLDESAGAQPEPGLPARPRCEDYLALYPLLGPVERLPLQLIEHEYWVRQRFGDRPAHQEYLRRFPAVAAELGGALRRADADLANESGQASGRHAGAAGTRRPSGDIEATTAHLPAGAAAETLPPTAPRQLGRYQVRCELGKGAFGVVYRAFDPELKRDVAIKVPHNRATSAGAADAYLAEARSLAELDHPGIVPVYDVGRTAEGLCYVVSKFVSGADLGKLIRQQRFTPADAAAIVEQVATALHHAHKRGLVHRDIKPANILVESRDGSNSGKANALQDHRPLLADFGLVLRDEAYATGLPYCGTPAYMSPEQARGESHLVDARSDIYSLGVVLYELLVGRRPYRATESTALLKEISESEVRPPRQLDDSVPVELERICLKALARRPADRYTTAADLAADLRSYRERAARNPRRRTLVWGAVALAAMAVPAVLAAVMSKQRAATSPVEPGPLRVVSLDVNHFANIDNRFDQPRGILGKQSFAAHLNDSVTVQAKLSRPAYAYLLAFRPDGQVELCFPEDDNQKPPLTDRPRYPSVSRDVNYGLNEGSGLWAFAVVASAKPLPSYREWLAGKVAPWHGAKVGSGAKVPAGLTNVVLWDDGQWIESLAPGGISRGSRGKGVPARQQLPKTTLVRITDWLKREAHTEAAAAIGFGVDSKE